MNTAVNLALFMEKNKKKKNKMYTKGLQLTQMMFLEAVYLKYAAQEKKDSLKLCNLLPQLGPGSL